MTGHGAEARGRQGGKQRRNGAAFEKWSWLELADWLSETFFFEEI